MYKYDAVIIGGGHNALVCAFYLARAGYDVFAMDFTGYRKIASTCPISMSMLDQSPQDVRVDKRKATV